VLYSRGGWLCNLCLEQHAFGDRVVGVVTRLRAGWPRLWGSIPGKGKRSFFLHNRPIQPFVQGQNDRRTALNVNVSLPKVWTLRMRVALRLFSPHFFMTCHLLKQRDHFYLWPLFCPFGGLAWSRAKVAFRQFTVTQHSLLKSHLKQVHKCGS